MPHPLHPRLQEDRGVPVPTKALRPTARCPAVNQRVRKGSEATNKYVCGRHRPTTAVLREAATLKGRQPGRRPEDTKKTQGHKRGDL